MSPIGKDSAADLTLNEIEANLADFHSKLGVDDSDLHISVPGSVVADFRAALNETACCAPNCGKKAVGGLVINNQLGFVCSYHAKQLLHSNKPTLPGEVIVTRSADPGECKDLAILQGSCCRCRVSMLATTARVMIETTGTVLLCCLDCYALKTVPVPDLSGSIAVEPLNPIWAAAYK